MAFQMSVDLGRLLKSIVIYIQKSTGEITVNYQIYNPCGLMLNGTKMDLRFNFELAYYVRHKVVNLVTSDQSFIVIDFNHYYKQININEVKIAHNFHLDNIYYLLWILRSQSICC